MKLNDLLTVLSEKWVLNPPPDEIEISGIVQDSRKVKDGDVFVAIEGQISDGHQYIDKAIRKGAAAIVGQRPIQVPSRIPYIRTPDSRAALATLAACFYQFPARKLNVIGITGTDGKTTTVSLIHSILSVSGYQPAMLTTVGATIGGVSFDTGVHVTTPDALEMQRLLSQMVAKGADYAVLEVTSHGLAQHRVDHCDFDVAAITNVTHEHLDYHGTYQRYLEAKGRLFESLKGSPQYKPDTPRVSILNLDDPSYSYLRHFDADLVWTYGLQEPADFRATDIRYTPKGTRFKVITPKGPVSFDLALVGQHNVYNALAAIAVTYSQGVSPEHVQLGLASVSHVIGRMERVDAGQSFDVFMDYAHTPNAIEQVLRAARKLTDDRVIVVCGLSGGLRDTTKRPHVGEIVGRLADKIVITSMDWYEEDVSEIMSQIAAGCEKAGRQEGVDYWCLRDRKEGIYTAIGLARPGDLVLIAGKAHETAINYGSVEYRWNERAVIVEALENRINRSL